MGIARLVWCHLCFTLSQALGTSDTGWLARQAIVGLLWIHDLGAGADDAALNALMGWGPAGLRQLRALRAAGALEPHHAMTADMLSDVLSRL